ncbi:hypothetical protein AMTRI_Chr12g236590 [Amborella trichopoda]
MRLRSKACTSKNATTSTKPFIKEVYHNSDCGHSMQPSKHAPASIKPYLKEAYHSSSCEALKHNMQQSKHAPPFIRPYHKEVYHSSSCEASKAEHATIKACDSLYKSHISNRCTTVPTVRL